MNNTMISNNLKNQIVRESSKHIYVIREEEKISDEF